MKKTFKLLCAAAAVSAIAAGCSLSPDSKIAADASVVQDASGDIQYVEPQNGLSDEELYDSDITEAPPAPNDDDLLAAERALASPSTPAQKAYIASLTADFAERDKLPQTTTLRSKWFTYSKYGPPAALYPKVKVPSGTDKLQWQRDRVIEVAKKYIGLPYKHYHIPILGLDCSNFTSWVYNYGLGIKFTSSVTEQAKVAGRKLSKSEALKKGDLLFFKDSSGRIIHAGLYIDKTTMIDESSSNKTGVQIKAFGKGWTKTNFAYARRVIE